MCNRIRECRLDKITYENSFYVLLLKMQNRYANDEKEIR